jgi:hypothetical protein
MTLLYLNFSKFRQKLLGIYQRESINGYYPLFIVQYLILEIVLK